MKEASRAGQRRRRGGVEEEGAGRAAAERGRGTGTRTATAAEYQALQSLLGRVRESLDATVDHSTARLSVSRSDMILNRVLDRVDRDRQRGAWVARTAKTVTVTVTATAAALWNSRIIRMLVP